jgi:membrane-associated phospholipid phosphatase
MFVSTATLFRSVSLLLKIPNHTSIQKIINPYPLSLRFSLIENLPNHTSMQKIFILFSLSLLTTTAFSQAEWEHKFVSNINPQHPSSDVWKTFSSTAKPISVALPVGMLAVGLIEKNKTLQSNSLEALGSLVIAAGTTEVLKKIVKRPRPYFTYNDIYANDVEDSYSFPSGHVSVAFSTAVSISLTAKKWYITVPALAWATGVGYSRMYLGQHYPSDVFVGALVGSGSAFLSHWITRKFFFTKKKKL